MKQADQEMINQLLGSNNKSMDELKVELLTEAQSLAAELAKTGPERIRDTFLVLARACNPKAPEEPAQTFQLPHIFSFLNDASAAAAAPGIDKLCRMLRVLLGSSFNLLFIFANMAGTKVIYKLLPLSTSDAMKGDILDILRLCCSQPNFMGELEGVENLDVLFDLLLHGHNDHKVNVAVILSFFLVNERSEEKTRDDILKAQLVPKIIELLPLESTDAFDAKISATGPAPILTLLQQVVANPGEKQKNSNAVKQALQEAIEADVASALKNILLAPKSSGMVKAKASGLLTAIELQAAVSASLPKAAQKWPQACDDEDGQVAGLAAAFIPANSSLNSLPSVDAVPQLVQNLASNLPWKERKEAVKSINDLATMGEHLRPLIKAGAIKALFSVLRDGADKSTETMAMSALWYMLFNKNENFHLLPQNDAVSLLGQQVAACNVDTSVLAASVLEHLFLDDSNGPKFRKQGIDAKLPKSLMELLIGPSDLGQGEAAAALHGLAQDEASCQALVQAGLVPLMAPMIADYNNLSSKPKVRMSALRAMSALTRFWEGSRNLILKYCPPEPLVAMLLGEYDSQQAHHAGVIVAFAAATSVKQKAQLNKAGALEAFMDMFKATKNDTRTIAISGIQHLCFESPENCVKVKNKGLIPPIMEVLLNPGPSDSRTNFFMVICHLCATEKTREALLEIDAVDKMLTLLEENDNEVRSYACHALFLLSGNDLQIQAYLVRRQATKHFEDIQHTGNHHGKNAGNLMMKKIGMNARRIKDIAARQTQMEKRNMNLLNAVAAGEAATPEPSPIAGSAALADNKDGIEPGMQVKIKASKVKKDGPTVGTVTWYDNDKRKWAVEFPGVKETKLFTAKDLVPMTANNKSTGEEEKAEGTSQTKSKRQRQKERAAAAAAGAPAEAKSAPIPEESSEDKGGKKGEVKPVEKKDKEHGEEPQAGTAPSPALRGAADDQDDHRQESAASATQREEATASSVAEDDGESSQDEHVAAAPLIQDAALSSSSVPSAEQVVAPSADANAKQDADSSAKPLDAAGRSSHEQFLPNVAYELTLPKVASEGSSVLAPAKEDVAVSATASAEGKALSEVRAVQFASRLDQARDALMQDMKKANLRRKELMSSKAPDAQTPEARKVEPGPPPLATPPAENMESAPVSLPAPPGTAEQPVAASAKAPETPAQPAAERVAPEPTLAPVPSIPYQPNQVFISLEAFMKHQTGEKLDARPMADKRPPLDELPSTAFLCGPRWCSDLENSMRCAGPTLQSAWAAVSRLREEASSAQETN